MSTPVQLRRTVRRKPQPSARKLRLMGGLALAVAVAALISSLALASGFLTVGGAGTGSASTSSVTLSPDTSATHACHYTDVVPGDLPGTASCTFSVSYSSVDNAVSAYVALSILVETQAGPAAGALTLYHPTGSSQGSGLTMTVTSASPAVSFTVPTTVTSCPTSTSPWGAAPAGSTCYELDTEPVSTRAISSPSTVTFTLTPDFPTSVKNPYQGGGADVQLVAQAVQSEDNTLACSPAAVAGQPCNPSAPFAWS